jgi:Putative beta barrel porin-7 (BBP7)
VPEVSLDMGYRFTSFFRASVGYDLLYWSSVARPGDQVLGVPKGTDYWAQGLHFRLGFDF